MHSSDVDEHSTAPSADRPLTESDAALRLGLKVATLRAWRHQRRGPVFVQLGRAIRYLPRRIPSHQSQIGRTERSLTYHRRRQRNPYACAERAWKLKDVMDIPLIGGWHITLFWSGWLIGAIALLVLAAVALVARGWVAR